MGNFPIRVSPSRTSIVPVNNQYLPRSVQEMAAVARTVYIANIDRVVERETVGEFFSRLCGTLYTLNEMLMLMGAKEIKLLATSLVRLCFTDMYIL